MSEGKNVYFMSGLAANEQFLTSKNENACHIFMTKNVILVL